MKIHIVQQGDTLWKLAKKYDVGIDQLKEVNNHLSNPDAIMPGMKIKIPTGGVLVKKQIVKKEMPIQAKEQPKVKEVPKKEEKISPKEITEPIKMPKKPEPQVMHHPIEIQPIQQTQMLTQQQYEQHLHNMNMNFNIYKPMPAPVAPVAPVAPPPKVAPKVPVPPKMPDMKELPKLAKPKPMPMTPPCPPPKKVVPKVPEVDEMAMAKQMLPPMPQCYPVTGIVPGCTYQVPSVYPYQQGFPPYPPMSQQMGSYGYPQGAVSSAMAGYTAQPMGGYPGQQQAYHPPMMPNYPQAGYGMGQPPIPPYGMVPQGQQWASQGNNTMGLDEDFDNNYSTGIPAMVPKANSPMQPYNWAQPNHYGDITMQQPMPPQQPVSQKQMPPQQWGFQQQPMMRQQPPYNPHPAQSNIEEETED